MKRYLAGFLVGVALATSVTAYAAQKIQIKVDGKIIPTAMSPQIVKGTVMVPINAVAPALGAKVAWDSKTNVINIYSKSYAPPAKASVGTVKVKAVGVTSGEYNTSGKFYETSAAVSIVNSDKTRAAEHVTVSINVLSTSGKILKTHSETISYIPPNSEAYLASNIYVDGNIPASSAQAFLNVSRWEREGAKILSFPFSNLTYENGDVSATIKGEIENPYNVDMKTLKVYAALYDSTNKLIGGGNTYVDLLPAKGKVGFEIFNGPVKNMDVAYIKAFADIGPFNDPLK